MSEAPFDLDHLKLTDFMDVATLQEIQDSFAAVANVKATITDASGAVLTQHQPTSDFLSRQKAIAQAEDEQPEGPQREGREYIAPIIIGGQRLGTLRMTASGSLLNNVDEGRLAQIAQKFSLDTRQIRQLLSQLGRAAQARPAAIQFLFLLANAVARLCYQEYQLRQRINELTAVYNVAMTLAEARDLGRVLQRTVQVVCEVMECKASSIRLIDKERDELIIKAAHNLSSEYLNKGPVRLSTTQIESVALGPQGYEYVRNMQTDPRVQYPEEARREGIVSMLSAGMRYKGKPVGVIRVYTAEPTTFSQLRIGLLKAVAAQAAAAIEHARLLDETLQAEQLERQVKMAAEVQQRMVPQTPPVIPGLELATVYVPAYTLGGDFYDLIPLPYNNIGLVVADVSGKGVPASLIMASVRAALRAQVDNVYYLYEVIRRLNLMLYRDTKDTEFVTLFYGVYDAGARRLTYCNAGHPPGLLLRDGKVSTLDSANMVLGVDPEQQYTQTLVDLRPGDTLLLYTDGLPDAMNFSKETFGRNRILEVFSRGGPSAEVVSQNLLGELREFVGVAKPSDDVTMIVARIT
jgi:sigma-B regulation protein RsbU (phosphoserine phosphatase)